MARQSVNLILRVCAALPVVLGVTTLVFLLLHLVPGDPLDVMLGEYAAPSDRAALAAALGLDRPLMVQWLDFVGRAAQFDFGHSLVTGRPVNELLGQHLASTAWLALAALAVSILVGVPLGALAAFRRNTAWDSTSTLVAVIAMSVPNFVLGPILILVFAVWLGWLPVGGSSAPFAIVLPALTLGLSLAAMMARMTRAALLDVLDAPFIVAARARGLRPGRIKLHYIGRNAALPVVTVIGLQFGALLGGAVITEVVFAWPGLGQLLIDSILKRDYPVVQACVMVIALSYVLLNTLTDVLYDRLDPRVGGP